MNQNSLATSIRAKLLNKSRENKQDFNLVLTRYALERLLYRLSTSQHSDQFLLKGALLFDLWILAKHTEFDGEVLSQAITATFKRRNTPLPTEAPLGLTEGFSKDLQKQRQWQAFLKKNGLESISLEGVIHLLGIFTMPIFESISKGELFSSSWEYRQPSPPQWITRPI